MASRVSGPTRRPGGPGAGDGARPRRAPRPPRRARRHRPGGRRLLRRHWKAVFFGLTAVAIAGAMAWALYGSTLLVVRLVRVSGTGKAISVGQVLAAARVPRGQPLIRVDTGAIAHRVAQLRQVQSAQVSKDWPATLVMFTVSTGRPGGRLATCRRLTP